ncbi:hypothetical protein EGW08_013058 [Elysia chlorotica]|uniref:Ig-like domain-containing protein n=1 Tax=Elysia chlorotica TaxID=188477 RepID=A0A3S1BZW3_ELYCH|nr:hypothetical protein EGW08_013058 [Elysia chlorotica]
MQAGGGRHSSLVCWLLCLVLARVASDQSSLTVQSQRIQELHACTGTSAYIPWPMKVMSRSGHTATVITLSFRERRGFRDTEIASYTLKNKLVGKHRYKERLEMSEEHSGVFLKSVGLADDGIFTAQARTASGRVWTRSTNLTVHVRPVIKGEKLTVGKAELLSPGASPKLHCVKLTCGLLEYIGYPPTHYVWQSQSKVLAVEAAQDDVESVLELCGPFQEEVTCSIGGFSSICTYDYVGSIFVDLPAPLTNTSEVVSAAVSNDLVLMIVAPVLAVGIPLCILAAWLLSHLMGDRRRRAWSSQPNHGEGTDIEDNMLTNQSLQAGDRSEEDEDVDTIGRSRATLNGIPGEQQGHNSVSVRILEGDRVHRTSSPWPGSQHPSANCNSVRPPGRHGNQGNHGHSERPAGSPDSVAKSALSSLDSRSTGDGSAVVPASGSNLEVYHGRERAFSQDNTLVKTPRVGFDVGTRDQGEIHRASEDEEEEEEEEDDDDEESQQPLVEESYQTPVRFRALAFIYFHSVLLNVYIVLNEKPVRFCMFDILAAVSW